MVYNSQFPPFNNKGRLIDYNTNPTNPANPTMAAAPPPNPIPPKARAAALFPVCLGPVVVVLLPVPVLLPVVVEVEVTVGVDVPVGVSVAAVKANG